MVGESRLYAHSISFERSNAITRVDSSYDISMQHAMIRIQAPPSHHPDMTSLAAHPDRAERSSGQSSGLDAFGR